MVEIHFYVLIERERGKRRGIRGVKNVIVREIFHLVNSEKEFLFNGTN